VPTVASEAERCWLFAASSSGSVELPCASVHHFATARN
jgi:hypothetical protein